MASQDLEQTERVLLRSVECSFSYYQTHQVYFGEEHHYNTSIPSCQNTEVGMLCAVIKSNLKHLKSCTMGIVGICMWHLASALAFLAL